MFVVTCLTCLLHLSLHGRPHWFPFCRSLYWRPSCSIFDNLFQTIQTFPDFNFHAVCFPDRHISFQARPGVMKKLINKLISDISGVLRPVGGELLQIIANIITSSHTSSAVCTNFFLNSYQRLVHFFFFFIKPAPHIYKTR